MEMLKNIFKKGIIFLLAFIMISLINFNCDLRVDKVMAADQTITIRFATYGLLEAIKGEYLKQAAIDFEKEVPNTKIEFVNLPYADLKQQVLIMANAGDAPDVVHGETSAFSSYVYSGYLEPLNELLSESYIEDIYPGVRESMSANGKLYAAPWICSPFVLLYNKELFEKAGLDPNAPPKTYDQMMKYAEKINQLKDNEGNKIYGLGLTTASVPISGDSIISTMFSFGGGIYNENGNVEVVSENNIMAFNYYKELYQKDLNPESAKLKDLRNLMALGRLGMYFDQIGGVSAVYIINPDTKGKVAAASMPATDFTEGLSLLENDLLHIMKDSEHKEVAAKFIEYLTSKELLTKYYETLPFLAGRKSVNESPEFGDDFIEPIKDSIYKVKSLPLHSNMTNALLEITSAAQRVTFGGESAEDTVEILDSKLKQILK